VRPVCSVSPLHHNRPAKAIAAVAGRPGTTPPWAREEDLAVSRSGSNTRKRRKLLAARFNEQEALVLHQRAAAAGIPLSAYMRSAALGAPAPRATRRPTLNHQMAGRLLSELGRIADELRRAAEVGNLTPSNPEVAAALRDLAEMRAVCLEALGRLP